MSVDNQTKPDTGAPTTSPIPPDGCTCGALWTVKGKHGKPDCPYLTGTQELREAIERCLPDVPSHARPYAVEKLLEVFESYAQQREREARIEAIKSYKKVLRYEKHLKAECMDTSQVNRIEVIDETGRAYIKGELYGTPVKVELSLQDEGRTLKIFVTPVEAEIKEERNGK